MTGLAFPVPSMAGGIYSADAPGLQPKTGVADGIRTRNNKLHKLGLYR